MERPSPKTTRVAELCTLGKKSLVTVPAETRIEDCVKQMLAGNLRHLLVAERGGEKIIGIISIKDVMKHMLNYHECSIETLTRLYRDDILDLS